MVNKSDRYSGLREKLVIKTTNKKASFCITFIITYRISSILPEPFVAYVTKFILIKLTKIRIVIGININFQFVQCIKPNVHCLLDLSIHFKRYVYFISSF